MVARTGKTLRDIPKGIFSQLIIPRVGDILFLAIFISVIGIGTRLLNMDGDLARPHIFTLSFAVLWVGELERFRKDGQLRLRSFSLFMIFWVNFQDGWRDILNYYQISWVIMHTNSRLVEALQAESDLLKAFQDQTAVILTRSD